MHLPEEPDSSPQINIVPMIDVIFAVLVFFILASLFLTDAEGMPVNLPVAKTGESQDQPHITITLTVQNELFVNGQPTNRDRLVDDLQPLLSSDQPSLVIIRADAQVSHGEVVALMDQLRRVRRVQLAIATQPPANP